jgi:hypothetical protein
MKGPIWREGLSSKFNFAAMGSAHLLPVQEAMILNLCSETGRLGAEFSHNSIRANAKMVA